MKKNQQRIAVVVVHGMGNQYPMDTLRGFVKALKPENSALFSSPNRIVDDKETRRLSFSLSGYDFYEYYWAHLVKEPGIAAVSKWAFSLLFLKKPSQSLKQHINTIHLIILLIVLLIALLFYFWFQLFKDPIQNIVETTIYGVILFYIFKYIISFASNSLIGTVTGSLGDVLKYTVPSPENIECRAEIRKFGVELLDKLHTKLNPNGKPRYKEIIVVGHSLGSIVAYDILSSLFAEYNQRFSNIPDDIDQLKLQEIKKIDVPDHTYGKYQSLQNELFNEFTELGNHWKVSHFLTLGSPLTHASMLFGHNVDDFIRKKIERELPTCPPQMDALDHHFAFEFKYNREDGKQPRNLLNLNHAAHFAETQWTNIFFTNDWIGGELSSEFGKGIRDIPVTDEHWLFNKIPLTTHTKYWDLKIVKSTEIIKRIFNKVREL